MKRIGLYSILLMGLVSGCEKTEKVEDFPQHQSKLVVNCFFDADSPFVFNLSKSLSPLDNAPFRNLSSPSAFIRVYEGSQLFDSMRVNPQGVFQGSRTPLINTTYRFDCYYPGFGFVKGEDYVPDTFKISGVKGFNTIKRSPDYQADSSKYVVHTSTLDITLQSRNTNGDYVFIEILPSEYDSLFGRFYDIYVFPEEISGKYECETIDNKIFISRDGQKIDDVKLRWELQKYYRNGKVVNDYELRIYSCSKSSYEYIRRSALQVQNQDDPFAQPAPVSNNIINGFGVFGGLSLQTVWVRF
jgi:hypothetical protein